MKTTQKLLVVVSKSSATLKIRLEVSQTNKLPSQKSNLCDPTTHSCHLPKGDCDLNKIVPHRLMYFMHCSQLVNCLGKIKLCSFVGAGMPMGVDSGISTAHISPHSFFLCLLPVDQDVKLSATASSTIPICILP